MVEDLGPFDLDPCAAPEPRPWPTARRHIALPDDGLLEPWEGMVWLNPPYGRALPAWIDKMNAHGRGIALTFARTETAIFHRSVWGQADALLFVRGRVRFHRPDGSVAGTPAAPSVLIAYSDDAARRIANSRIEGHMVVEAAAVIVSPAGKRVTWREVVLEAMAGRPARLRDIYAAAQASPRVERARRAGTDWQAQIRRALQVYCRPVDRGVWSPA